VERRELNRLDEEQVVAALEALGVSYLSRRGEAQAEIYAPCQLLAALVRQPSSRVRAALIALLLARPDYSAHSRDALSLLNEQEAQTFKLFYSAAVLLQRQYAPTLHTFLNAAWQELPDLFSVELGITGQSTMERLRSLAHIHARLSGLQLNWTGTYENAALHLLRSWKVDAEWNQ
jgi:hypothetical protein